jgi:two-component system, NarL family, sensor histidine kinase BarA
VQGLFKFWRAGEWVTKAVISLLAFVIATLAGIWILATTEIANEQRRAESDAVRDAESFARAYAEQTTRTFRAADQATRFLKYQAERNNREFNLQESVAAGTLPNDISVLYSLVDANGDVYASSQAFKPTNLADREHFRVHTKQDSGKLFVSKPVLGRVSNKWSIQISRRINAPDGSFAGVVVVSMDPFYFARVYEDFAAPRKGLVTLVGEDGVVRVRQLGNQTTLGQDLSGSSTFQSMLTQSAGSMRAKSAIDKTERSLAFRKLEGYPLFILVGLSVDEVLAPFVEYRRTVISMAWLSTFLVLLFSGLTLRMITELDARRRQALAASEAKSQFLSNMSHELRTPLNGILGYAELLEMEMRDAEMGRYARAITTSGNHLLTLVNAVLDMDQVSSGKLAVLQVPVVTRDLIREAVETHLSSAHRKGLSLSLDVSTNVPDEVMCDRTKVLQVLNNLLHNAIKFTAAGDVRLRVVEDGNGELQFSVIDTGPGIPPEKQAAVFDRFVQADTSETRPHQGSGIGLALVRDLVALMGGRVQLRSVVNKGSTFSFSIPVLPTNSH